MAKHKLTLRDLYRSLELPGSHLLRAAHASLDADVCRAYGMGRRDDPLRFLLELNQRVAESERRSDTVQGPGWPATAGKPMITKDSVKPARA